MSGRAPNEEANEPATLFRVMQTAIGQGLRERYEAPQKMSHQLFVLMMQMNDRARRERAQAEQAAAGPGAAANTPTKAPTGQRQTAAASDDRSAASIL